MKTESLLKPINDFKLIMRHPASPVKKLVKIKTFPIDHKVSRINVNRFKSFEVQIRASPDKANSTACTYSKVKNKDEETTEKSKSRTVSLKIFSKGSSEQKATELGITEKVNSTNLTPAKFADKANEKQMRFSKLSLDTKDSVHQVKFLSNLGTPICKPEKNEDHLDLSKRKLMQNNLSFQKLKIIGSSSSTVPLSEQKNLNSQSQLAKPIKHKKHIHRWVASKGVVIY